MTASRTSPACPQGRNGPSPMVPLTGRLVLPDPLGNGRPAPRWRCPGALAPDHPRTAGPRDSPSRGPRPWASNQRLVKGEMSGSPPISREPLCPSFPLRGYHQGGFVRSFCTRRLVPVSGPSEDVHLHPQGNASCPKPGSSNPMFNHLTPPTAWSGSNHQEVVPWWWIRTDTTLDLRQ